MSLAINPLENRWPIKSCVQGEPPLINADCQGASLMYFSFKGSVSTVFLGGGSEPGREQSVGIPPVYEIKIFTRAEGSGIGQNPDAFNAKVTGS